VRASCGRNTPAREIAAGRKTWCVRVKIIGGERGINSPAQGTVSQRFLQNPEYLYHHHLVRKEDGKKLEPTNPGIKMLVRYSNAGGLRMHWNRPS
jgi:hypothetical protein